MLILNKKAISNYEAQLFEQELDKFRPHQNRLLQANHKQAALMKELTATFNALLQDKRVRSEQGKYEAIQRTRSSAIQRYKRAYQEFLELEAGLHSAKNWYGEMRETVDSLEKNVETFVNNRRSEGAQLLDQIEQDRSVNKSSQAELERERLRGLMERMSMEPGRSPPRSSSGRAAAAAAPLLQAGQGPARYPQASFQGHYQVPKSPAPGHQHHPQHPQHPQHQQLQHGHAQGAGGQPGPAGAKAFSQPAYNPSQYGPTGGPTSPPASQTTFGLRGGPTSPPPSLTSFGQGPPATSFGPGPPAHPGYGAGQHGPGGPGGPGGLVPPGFVPPPPPPGPPPPGPQQTIHYGKHEYGAPPGPGPQQAHDPWAGLSAWK